MRQNETDEFLGGVFALGVLAFAGWWFFWPGPTAWTKDWINNHSSNPDGAQVRGVSPAKEVREIDTGEKFTAWTAEINFKNKLGGYEGYEWYSFSRTSDGEVRLYWPHTK